MSAESFSASASVISTAMDQALVYYQNGKGSLDVVGFMVLLEKHPAGWVVKRRLLIWEA